MLRTVVLAILAVSTPQSVGGAYCHWQNGSNPTPHGPQNTYPINEAVATSTLVGTVPNGKLFNISVPNDGGNTTSHFTVAHIYGNASARGTAYGQLLGRYLNASAIVDEIWEYFKKQVTTALPGVVPKFLADLIAEVGLDVALGLTYDITKKYTDPDYYTEIEATAAASGVDYKKLRDMNQIAGLTQGSCSMFGAWGEALEEKDGVLQLRALDWDMGDAIVNHPHLIVVHSPTQTYVMQGIIGLMGALTGVSDKQLGISEIGVSFPDKSFGEESRFGVPFIFALRDILDKDHTLDDAITRLQGAKRTCDLILGVGDGKPGAGGGKGFRGFQYSSSVCNVIEDSNLIPVADWHKPIDNVVYFGMDWICPGNSQALHDGLERNYGKLTAEVAIRDITAVETSGDTHIAYYDLKNMHMWVSFAAQTYYGGPREGYARQFTHFDVRKLFDEPRP